MSVLKVWDGTQWVEIPSTLASINDLGDVTVASLAEGDLLVYDAGDSVFKNVAKGADWTQPVYDASQSEGLSAVLQHPVIALKAPGHANITTATDITWTTSSLKDSVYTHSTSTDADEITIGQDGYYRIVYVISGKIDSAGLAQTLIQIDTGGGFATLDNAICGQEMNTANARFQINYDHIHSLSASDIIKVTANIVSAGQWDVRASETRLSITQIRRV